MNTYEAVLPILKAYILAFQSHEPMAHLLHKRQLKCFRNFLSCFVQPKYITGNALRLKELNISATCTKFLCVQDLFIGKDVRMFIKEINSNKNVSMPVKSQLRECEGLILNAYVECGAVLQAKLPLDNEVLVSLAAINPHARLASTTHRRLKHLVGLMPPEALSEHEKNSIELEVHKFCADDFLPPFPEGMRVDDWWVLHQLRYPCLTKVALIALSIFSGPHVEGSFSVMTETLTKKASRRNVESYSAAQTLKYSIRASGKSAVQLLAKKKGEAVDQQLVRNMKCASSKYRLQNKAMAELKAQRKLTLEIKKKQEDCKAEFNRKRLASALKEARNKKTQCWAQRSSTR